VASPDANGSARGAGGRQRRCPTLAHYEPLQRRGRACGCSTYQRAAYEARARAGTLPSDLPAEPQRAYREAWAGWRDWLGPAPRRGRPCAEEWAFVHAQDLRTAAEFYAWRTSAARPADIPMSPDRVHADEWRGWRD